MGDSEIEALSFPLKEETLKAIDEAVSNLILE